ncbi:tyrosinase family protein [Streptomyces sp. B1866]|uniref:tyrosinase family protein n=1 Tax=Streptomyces sp. B1866 TaxID=3075431 RepID=UPI002890D929|nr:tyrosinase family protein [Streptomyces sp. B1866]MDT3398337.1 tyrosinase family protein [Streptomyces sp. B1866]
MAGTRVRRDITKMDTWDPQILWYARAVRRMKGKKKPEADPTSWLWQTNIHGSRVQPPKPEEWDQCPHGGWFFLPWHRAYLHCFEQIVLQEIRDMDGPEDWALPYWNYTRVIGDVDSPESKKCRRLPDAFRTPQWPDGEEDGSTNPLFLAPPDRGQNAANGFSAQWTEVDPTAALHASLFPGSDQFGSRDTDGELPHSGGGSGLLEQRPHNNLHVFVGGLMSQFVSARDPVFWLHHSNIDRYWPAWLTDMNHKNPQSADWLDRTFAFRDVGGEPVTLTSRDVLSPEALGYRYESLTEGTGEKAAERRAFLMAAVSPTGPSEPVIGRTGAKDLGPDPVVMPLAPETEPRAALAPVARRETESRVMLTIDDVRADAPPGTSYRVFAGAREGHPEDLDPDGPCFVGHIDFFGSVGDDVGHHEGAGGVFRYDITDLLHHLHDQGIWDGEGLPPVVVTPAPLDPPPERAAAAAAEAAPVPLPDSRPRIGGVSVATV